MAFQNIIKKLRAIERFDIEQETINIINENRYYIEALLRLQLQSGKDGNNEPVTIFGRDFYKDATIFEKERHGVGLGKETGFVTNYMNGFFYSGLIAQAQGRTFEITSTVPYFTQIILRSGEQIMYLNTEHLQEFSKEVLIPQLQIRLKAFENGI